MRLLLVENEQDHIAEGLQCERAVLLRPSLGNTVDHSLHFNERVHDVLVQKLQGAVLQPTGKGEGQLCVPSEMGL